MKVLYFVNFVKLCFCSPYISGRFWWHRCQQKSTEWDQKTKFQQNSTPPSSTEAEEIQKFAGRDPAKYSKVKIDKSSQGVCKEIAVNIDLTSPFYFYDTLSIVMLALVQRPITSIASKKVKRFLLRISKINDCSAWAYTLSFFNRLSLHVVIFQPVDLFPWVNCAMFLITSKTKTQSQVIWGTSC